MNVLPVANSRLTRSILLALYMTFAAGAPAVAQTGAETDVLTLERIHGTSDFSAQSVSTVWMSDGLAWTTTRPEEGEGAGLWRVDAVSGERETVISERELVPPGADEPLEIESFAFSGDERRVLLFTGSQQVWRARTKGTYWVFDRDRRELIPVSQKRDGQMFAKLSPDAGRVAFVHDHNLYVTDLETGEERALTADGSDTIINGTTDWVYEEELNLRDAFRWSPDGRRIAYWRFDQSPIAPFYLLDETQLYPELIPVRYPKAGTPNSRVRVGAVEVESGRTVWFDTGTDDDIYIPRMAWASSSDELTIQRLDRHQNTLELLLADAATGATRLLLTETDDAWVDVTDHPTWLESGQRFLWTSQRDGFDHIYVLERDGTLVRQLTSGDWDVETVSAVDESKGLVYLTAGYESPLTRSVLSVPLDGGQPEVVFGGRGTHGPRFSPSFRYVVNSHSTIDSPPAITLYELDAADVVEVRSLTGNDELRDRLARLELGTPEFIEVEAADGTPLNAFVIKPADFDPSRRYGLLMYVYGGPGSQTVVDRWGGSRYVWHQYLAANDILVASVDNRGTGARGRAFEKQTYLKLGQLETADQLAALQQFADLPYVDEERIGIWGWSYGGYMTLMTTLLSDGRVAAGVSVAPVTDWKLYDTIYTERFMRTPGENSDGYVAGAPLSHAARLESPLLIVHGTGDDNVHSQNTVLMTEELEKAGKQFEMRLYPNKRHGITGAATRVNLFGMITDFLFEHLKPPPASVSMGERAAEPANRPGVGSG